MFYTEPAAYVLSKGLFQSYHSTSGTLEVIELAGFPGDDTSTKERVLIILLGFDGELSSFINEEVAAKELILINGFPSYSPIFKDISIINNEKLIKSQSGPPLMYVSASNPFETFNLLEKLKNDRPNTYFNIAALGTKPMALGACLFATMYSSVRVVYPLPEKYADITTEECYLSWLYEVPLKFQVIE